MSADTHAHGDHSTDNNIANLEVSVRCDIYKLVEKLKTNKRWDAAKPTISFVPRGVDEVEDKTMTRITFRGFRLLEIPMTKG